MSRYTEDMILYNSSDLSIKQIKHRINQYLQNHYIYDFRIFDSTFPFSTSITVASFENYKKQFKGSTGKF